MGGGAGMTGLRALWDDQRDSVVLMFGEAEVMSWPVSGAGDGELEGYMRVKWRRDKFVARKLGAILEAVERCADDG